MDHLLTIGAFSDRCGLSRSALRFYDECNLLRPVAVDDASGYRYYAESQVADGELVRRLRAAGFSVDGARRYLLGSAPERRELLESYEARLAQRTTRLREALEALRSGLGGPWPEPLRAGLTLSAEALLGALRQVLFAASNNPERPELGGILVEVRDGSLRVVATDSYRLAIGDVVLDEGQTSAPVVRGFFSIGALHKLLVVLDEAGPVTLRPGLSGGLEVAREGTTVAWGESAENYPAYDATAPRRIPPQHRVTPCWPTGWRFTRRPPRPASIVTATRTRAAMPRRVRPRQRGPS